MNDKSYRPDIAIPPSRIARLPVSRGYPVPWFVDWINGEPEFRAADGRKFERAIRERLCWVCGEVIGRYVTFVLGPMCGVNRVSAEPPCHLECAQYSAINCPFLSKPRMERRQPEQIEAMGGISAGIAILRNPGVTLLWSCRDFKIVGDGNGGILFSIGDPTSMEWYREGRKATRAEIDESVRTGLPRLQELADSQSPEAVKALNDSLIKFQGMLPAA